MSRIVSAGVSLGIAAICLFSVSDVVRADKTDQFVDCFETVDSWYATERQPNFIRVKMSGIMEGDTEASDKQYFDLEPACERMALLSMSKPGMFNFTVLSTENIFDHARLTCKLERRE